VPPKTYGLVKKDCLRIAYRLISFIQYLAGDGCCRAQLEAQVVGHQIGSHNDRCRKLCVLFVNLLDITLMVAEEHVMPWSEIFEREASVFTRQHELL